MDSLPAMSVILLLLTTGPLLGWTLPTDYGEIPEAIDEENVLDSGPQERPAIADPGVIPLEATDVEAPLDDDVESQQGSSSGDEADEEREEPLDADEKRGGPLNTDANPYKPLYYSDLYRRIFPDYFKNLFHRDAFDRIGDVVKNFEVDMNEIIRKAMDEATRFNGTTTNSTKVVEDEKGNKFKVDTVIKKGDRNQTLVMEIIESLPPTTNRTKRSNWLAEPNQ